MSRSLVGGIASPRPPGRIVVFTLAAMSLLPAAGGAQVAWETPRLLGPHTPHGFGVHWLRAGTLPGDGESVLITWSPGGLPEGMSIRGGGGTGAGGETAGFGGVDVRAPLGPVGGDVVDLGWNTGVGVGVGQYVVVTLPVALSAGRTWSSGPVWVSPYVSVGIAFDLRIGDDGPSEEFSANPSADLGVDLSLDSGRRFILRAATSLGDRQALVVGAMARTGGRGQVR